MKSIEIDRSKRLKEEPEKGHNRWHPDVPPLVEADPGEEVVLQTRDASDGQMKPTVSVADFDNFDQKVAHPLTGPVYVKGPNPATCLRSSTSTLSPRPTAGPGTVPALAFCATCSKSPTPFTGKSRTAGLPPPDCRG